MGVMECHRKGCKHILCDTLVCGYYLCWDCRREFVERFGGEERTEREFAEALEAFIAEDCRGCNGCKSERMTIDQFIDKGGCDQ